MNCDPAYLAREARCLACLSPLELSASALWLACQWASGGVVTTCSSPVATAATNVASDSFSANWNGVPGALSYRLDVSDDPAFGSFVGTFDDLDVGLALTSLVTGLTVGETYYYRVRSVCAYGASENSNTISAIAAYPCGTPSDMIQISGAGTTDSSGNYVLIGPLEYLGPVDNMFFGNYSITSDGSGGWFLKDGASNILYTSSASAFPCNWVTYDGGIDPPPTGQYV